MSYQATILGNSPLRYYRLDELSGTLAHDIGAERQNGTINGGVALGQTGLLANDSDASMLFNGSTGYISFADTGLPTGANPWSVECWVSLSSLANYPIPLYYGSTSTNAGVVLWVNSGNSTINVGFQNAGNVQGPVLSTGTIYHMVGTYDGSTLRLYVNGTLAAATNTTGAVVLNSGSIGSELGASDFVSGRIDEVAIYSYALTPAQVLADYQAGASLPPQSLIVSGLFVTTTLTLKQSDGTVLARGLPAQIDTVNIPWNMEVQGMNPTDWFDIYSIGWVTPIPQRGNYLVDEALGTKFNVFGKAAVYVNHIEVRCSVPSGVVP